MKFFTLMLSLYFLTLSVIPCHDSEDFEGKYQQTIAHVQQDNPCSDTQDETCSPLCTCNCCGTNLTLFTITEITFSKVNGENKYSSKQDSFISEPSQAIWQPPKIS